MTLDRILENSLAIKRKDKVLIITDKKKEKIAKKIYKACKKLSNKVDIIYKPIGKYDGEEPPTKIAKQMLKYNVILAPTEHSISHTKSRKNASKKGIRIATMPGITEKMLTTSLLAVPKELDRLGNKLMKVLKNGSFVFITTPSGTSIGFSIKGRVVENNNAVIRKRGAFSNLPDGEVSLSPEEGTANGIIAIDSAGEYAKPRTKVLVMNGLAIDITNKNCKLSEIFDKVKNSRNIAELGIGTNKKAKFMRSILNDEKIFGTAHIAFGSNISYNGKIYSSVHIDVIQFKPTIWVDNKLIMRNGKLI